MTAERCFHDSASGVDQAPLDDPAKVWKCDECGWLHRVVTENGISREIPVVAS